MRRSWPGVRRGIALIALLNYLALAVGLPLPSCSYAATVNADGSLVLHPCSGHRCGCGSAEQCWKSCCCFSPAEKLAWARRNGVTPPAFVMAEPESRPTVSRSPVRKSCCSAEPVVVKSCCSKKAIETSTTASPVKEPRWISYLAAARCRGAAAAEWLNVPVSLPVKVFDCAANYAEQVRPFLPPAESILASAFLSTADPPPRIV